MTNVYDAEGFDNISTGTLLVAKGWVNTDTPGTGLLGHGKCLTISAGGNASRALPTAYTTLTAGFRVKHDSTPNTTNWAFMQTGAAAQVWALAFDANKRITIKNSANTVIATGTTIWAADDTHYVEVKAFCNGASGTVELHLDGVAGEIASTVVNIGSTGMQIPVFSRMGSGQVSWYDDCYWGPDFLGDIEVPFGVPTGDGANTGWTPDTGSPHYSRVNELTGTFPDSDTSYVKTNAAGNRDTYPLTALGGGVSTVYAVILESFARKDDTGARTVDAVIRHGTTDYDKGSAVPLATSYRYQRWLYDTNDASGTPWTPTSANAAEYGIKSG